MLQVKILYAGWMILQMLSGTVYDFSIPTIEGDTHSLSIYQPKKILIVTLPISESPQSNHLLSSLDSLAANRVNQLVVIAVPSIEDGYNASTKTVLQQWYRSRLSSKVIISEGMYTRKTSGSRQSDLFKWLTTAEQNETFGVDVEGPGYKFLTNNTGALFAVLRPQTRISSNTLNTLIDQ
jgi:glutathione peroxidase-family protein